MGLHGVGGIYGVPGVAAIQNFPDCSAQLVVEINEVPGHIDGCANMVPGPVKHAGAQRVLIVPGADVIVIVTAGLERGPPECGSRTNLWRLVAFRCGLI